MWRFRLTGKPKFYKHKLAVVWMFFTIDLKGLHDDSANDNSAIDKMAARFWHTDDSATLKKKKKGQSFFPTPHGCQKLLKLPLTGFT